MLGKKFAILFIGTLLMVSYLFGPTEEERQERLKIQEARELQESIKKKIKRKMDEEREKIRKEMKLSLFNYVEPIVKSFDTVLLRGFGFGTTYHSDTKTFDDEFFFRFSRVNQNFDSKWIGRIHLKGSSNRRPNRWSNHYSIPLTFEKKSGDTWSLVSKNGYVYVVDQEVNIHIDIHDYIRSKFLTVER
jgi:hypothetical protein